ncbi:neuronal calcium sensor 2 [Brachionus plicatilis]|uniref:Neuronal calcium sensor 2 n=1 Tax=Brachionus plicatilis TaxID=10195 RepID=A0A3M7PVB8_BRAPC|nr:neuronal calcium sensor 2 [Brachionus plicatilis]
MGNKAAKPKKKNPAILTEDEVNLLLSNTSFSREEIYRWHDGFIKDCPKGQLDKKKFMDAYKAFYPQGKADKFCSHVFKVFDFDNSGKIDFTEFLIAISVTAQGDAHKKLSMAFRMYDVDRNGRVDKKEMEKIIEAIYDLLGEEHRKGENSPTERVKTIMFKLDKDQNGYLTEQEFVEGCLADPLLRSLLAPNS